MFKVVVLAGPTAVGKTAIATRLAALFNTCVINADSRQLYKEIGIGTAKPTAEEMGEVPHYFVDSLSVEDTFTAGDFQKQATEIIQQLKAKGKQTVIVSGGTGLYLNALMYGMHALPDGDEEIRAELNALYEKEGLASLFKEASRLDAAAIHSQNENNPQRLMRIIEVCRVSGKKYSEFLQQEKSPSDFSFITIALDTDRKKLYQQIESRVEAMMKNGLLEEVKRMMPNRNCYALKTVGYKELFEYLDGDVDLAQAIDLIKQHTRNYAKRQLTWFRKDKNYHWFSPDEFDAIHQFISVELLK